MTEQDMPAKDAARFGGPAGWRYRTRQFKEWFSTPSYWGVAIEGYPDGKIYRNAIKVENADRPEIEAVSIAAPVLKQWVNEMEAESWNRHDRS